MTVIANHMNQTKINSSNFKRGIQEIRYYKTYVFQSFTFLLRYHQAELNHKNIRMLTRPCLRNILLSDRAFFLLDQGGGVQLYWTWTSFEW